MATFLQAFLFFIALLTLNLISRNSYITFVPQISPINDRELHGNFLHITDFHPDPYYVSNVTARSRCHDHFQADKRPKHMKRGISGPWGAPATVCDTPLGLIDATFEWLEKNWKNKIDFIIWTGDNARHDNDENIPRTPEEIFQLNRMIADKFLKTFGDTNNFRKRNGPPLIPIVPSIGNNDIYPNNIILPGPNDLLKGLHNIWSPFIPKGQHKTFLNGGYFYTEVIPGKLMVVSLNTLYFYNANTAVNGCKAKSQPGTIEMRWLNDVLKRARKQGMKVYLTGHVGPRPKQYMRSCYRKYGRLSLKYHDIILGHFYGHSNMDHFFFINAKDVRRRRRGKLFVNNENDDETFKDDKNIYDDDDDDDDDDYDDDDDEYDNEYEDEDDYEDEDEVKDYDDDDDDCGDGDGKSLKIGSQEEITSEVSQNNTQDEIEIDDGDGDEENGKVETNVYNINRYMIRLLKHYSRLSKSEKEYAVIHINPSIIPTFFPALRIFKYNTTEVINKEVDITKKRHPDAPSHINTFLTPLGYTQYFVNLTYANLHPNITPEFTVEYTTWNDYNMKDLTVPSWVQLARKIVSHGFRSSLWKRIQENLMVGTRKLVRQKSKKHYRYSESREKGPEDYLASLSF